MTGQYAALHPPEWAVFCIYGPQHVPALRRLLLPGLAAEADLPVYLLNYAENRSADIEAGGYSEVFDLSLQRPPGRIGFGWGVNYLFAQTRPRRGFFLVNPDSIPMRGCLERLWQTLAAHRQAGLIEARQWPTEHPKEYDPITGATPWSSCAFCLLSSEAFDAVGGFDPIYFLYNEDVDLSWRLRLAGYDLVYVPEATVAHFTGMFSYRPDRFYAEHFYTSRNFLVLSYKFFGAAGERQAIAMLHASRLPAGLKNAILQSYANLKPAIRRYPGRVEPDICKITGFNLFHELRTS